ncbi:NIF3 family protein [Mycobacterium avium subsp. avium 2285 (R)]|nr:NIF3 family protein [Mycobacterium avium subsp. avium 2285 (R)]
MSVKLADVIAVLDEAYPPGLAEPWDSVGLVCGDPDEPVESVTVAVDATPAVVDEVPAGGLLLAHHPLLLRGVDTVAASTPKGALVHRLIRTGRSLFTAHTNADSASPGVSDALADALGLTVEAVLEPARPASDLDKWVIYVPGENADAVREAVFAAGAGHIGDYSHCSWSVTGIGQFLPHEGASPAVGSVGRVERVAEERVEVVAPHGPGPQCWRRCAPPIPTRSPRSTSSRCCPARRRRAGPHRAAGVPGAVAALRVPGRRGAAGDVLGSAGGGRPGAGGVAGRGVRRRRRFAAGRRGRRRGAGLPHRRPAPPPCRRASPGLRGGPDRRGTLGERIPVVRPGRRPAAVPVRWTARRAGELDSHRPVECRARRG